MSNSQESNTENNKKEFKKRILPIRTIEQMVSSHLVAEIILELRGELIQKTNNQLIVPIPELDNITDKRATDLYYRAAETMKFKPLLIQILKLALEDIFVYNFAEDASVSGNDNNHLTAMFGSKHSDLSNIDLQTHTLNVLEEAIILAEKSGRANSMAVAILGALMHDFGKSTEVRKLILGEGSQRGYKPHPEVSQIYVQDLLVTKLYNSNIEISLAMETIDYLGHLVKNHHPNNQKLKEDLEIKFIINADHKARKKEFEYLRQKRRK